MPGAKQTNRGNDSYFGRDRLCNDRGTYQGNGFGRRPRPSLAGSGPQRPSEFDELRHHGFSKGLRLSARESRKTYVGSASQGTFDLVGRDARACRALCAAVTRLSPARHTGKDQLIWKSAGTTTISKSPS